MPPILTRAEAKLGVADGLFAPCPTTPNCVSSQASDAAHAVPPLAYSGSAFEARRRLRDVVGAMPRTRLMTETQDYLHFEFTSLLLRFVDDVEFYVDAASNCIHVRSASRLGRYDFGVNRRRVEAIRRAWAAGVS